MPMCHIVILSLTWFNHPVLTSPHSRPVLRPAKVVLELAPNRTQLSLSSLHFRTLASSQHSLTVFQPLLRAHLQRLLLLVYMGQNRSPIEMHLPAHLNNVMNKYKVTIHQLVGRRASFPHRKDWLPSTYKVLLAIYFNGFMLVAYCFLISTAKVQPFSLFKTPTLTLLNEPRNQ